MNSPSVAQGPSGVFGLTDVLIYMRDGETKIWLKGHPSVARTS